MPKPKPQKSQKPQRTVESRERARTTGGNFHIEFENDAQKYAWASFKQHDILFLVGPAGTGKTHLATAFAIERLLKKEADKIVITRPIVAAGEDLGYLPGVFEEKVHPYMMPVYDCFDRMVGREGGYRERVNQALEVAPIAYMRGRTFHNSVCIFDEAQNATLPQLKLFLTRMGKNSKLIITGDPTQSDLFGDVALMEVVDKLRDVSGIGIFEFKANSIVRHKLVGEIVKRLS